MIKVEYRNIQGFMDSVTISLESVNFDVLIINRQGLYYVFHSSQILNAVQNAKDNDRSSVCFHLNAAFPVPATIAKMFTGE